MGTNVVNNALTVLPSNNRKYAHRRRARATPLQRLSNRVHQILYLPADLDLLIIDMNTVVVQIKANNLDAGHLPEEPGYDLPLLPARGPDHNNVRSDILYPGEGLRGYYPYPDDLQTQLLSQQGLDALGEQRRARENEDATK
jgi:hypothetical protein